MEGVYKNGVPLLLYLDIFKNFFANTQEKKFYMLKGAGEVALNFEDTYQSSHDKNYIIGKNQESIQITKTTKIKTNLTDIDYQRFWDSIKVTTLESDGGPSQITTAENNTNNSTIHTKPTTIIHGHKSIQVVY